MVVNKLEEKKGNRKGNRFSYYLLPYIIKMASN